MQDISKAYDGMDIDILQQAMNCIKLPTFFISLIMNLLTDRSSKVIIDSVLSNEFNVVSRVEQGGILSPALWVIYYDPLFELINNNYEGFISSCSFSRVLSDLNKDANFSTRVSLVG